MPEPSKPLISYLLVTYNQEKFVKEAVESALAQTYSPMEIIISDDCSTDRTFEIIKETVANYQGLHKITISRNSNNLGIGKHLNKVMAMAKGELFVMASGDDVAYPNKTSTFVSHWLSNPNKILALTACSENIDDNGQIFKKTKFKTAGLDIHPTIDKGEWNGCCVAISKNLFKTFGPLRYNSADRTWFYRASYLGGVYRINEIIIKYRTSGISKSSQNLNQYIYKETNMRKMILGNVIQIKFDLIKFPQIEKKYHNILRQMYIKSLTYNRILTNDSYFLHRIIGLCCLIKNHEIKKAINDIISLAKIKTDKSNLLNNYFISKLLEKLFMYANISPKQKLKNLLEKYHLLVFAKKIKDIIYKLIK